MANSEIEDGLDVVNGCDWLNAFKFLRGKNEVIVESLATAKED